MRPETNFQLVLVEATFHGLELYWKSTLQDNFWKYIWRERSLISQMKRNYMCKWQKQPPRGVLRRSCSQYMEQNYRRTPMPKGDFKGEITLRHGCSPVNLLHIFTTPFTKNISGWLPLNWPRKAIWNNLSWSFVHVIPLHLWYMLSFSPYLFPKKSCNVDFHEMERSLCVFRVIPM